MAKQLRYTFLGEVSRFKRDSRGQLALTFSLSLIPMMAFIGSAVDYSRAVTTRANLQQATDATVLSIVKKAGALSTSALQTQAQAYLTSASQDPNAVLVSAPQLQENNSKLCINTQSVMPTAIMKIVQVNSVTVTAYACATNSGGTFEIAMALDNTGSMGTYDYVTSRTKIQNEVLAAKNLVNTVFAGNTSSPNYQISVVPFTSSVTVGTQYNGEAWVDTLGKSSIHWENFPKNATNTWNPTSRFDLFSAVSSSWGGCFEERPQPYSLSDTPPDPNYPDTLFVPMFAPDESASSSKNGYSSPNNNYLSSDTAGVCGTSPDGTNATALDNGGWTYGNGVKTWNDGQSKLCKYKGQKASSRVSGPNWGCDSSAPPIQLLTNQASPLTTVLGKMSASGTTNLVSGFMWAWRTISPNGPFASPNGIKPYNYTSPTGIQNTKVIVFMTDGYNNWQPDTSNVNQGYYSAFGYYNNNRMGALPIANVNGVVTNQKPSASNQRDYLDSAFLTACTNAKAAGIQIYTIGFSIPNDPIDTTGINVLKSCATSPDMAYVATDGNQIVNIFGTIATNIGSARLSN